MLQNSRDGSTIRLQHAVDPRPDLHFLNLDPQNGGIEGRGLVRLPRVEFVPGHRPRNVENLSAVAGR